MKFVRMNLREDKFGSLEMQRPKAVDPGSGTFLRWRESIWCRKSNILRVQDEGILSYRLRGRLVAPAPVAGPWPRRSTAESRELIRYTGRHPCHDGGGSRKLCLPSIPGRALCRSWIPRRRRFRLCAVSSTPCRGNSWLPKRHFHLRRLR